MYGDKVTEPIESAYDIGPAVKQTITVSRRYQKYVGLFGVLRHRGTLDSTFRALGSCSGQGKIFLNTTSFLFGKAKVGIKKKSKISNLSWRRLTNGLLAVAVLSVRVRRVFIRKHERIIRYGRNEVRARREKTGCGHLDSSQSLLIWNAWPHNLPSHFERKTDRQKSSLQMA